MSKNPKKSSSKQSKRDPELVYTVLERVGKGAFGEVFRGEKKDSKEIVAIKIIDLEGIFISTQRLRMILMIFKQKFTSCRN